MERITIKTFNEPIEAHIIKAKLESEGLVCYLYDENIVSINPLFNNAVGGIKLKVHADEFDKASSILNALDNQDLIDESTGNKVKCPKCDSEELYSNFHSTTEAKSILANILALVLMVFPIYSKNVYRCKKCEFEFDKI